MLQIHSGKPCILMHHDRNSIKYGWQSFAQMCSYTRLGSNGWITRAGARFSRMEPSRAMARINCWVYRGCGSLVPKEYGLTISIAFRTALEDTRNITPTTIATKIIRVRAMITSIARQLGGGHSRLRV